MLFNNVADNGFKAFFIVKAEIYAVIALFSDIKDLFAGCFCSAYDIFEDFLSFIHSPCTITASIIEKFIRLKTAASPFSTSVP